MGSYVKYRTVRELLGPPVRMESLTDEQIREFYFRQAADGFGEDALRELERSEKKTRAEILKIIGLKERKMITEETKQKIIELSIQGMGAGQIAAKLNLGEKAVGYHLTCLRKAGKIPPAKQAEKAEKPAPVKEPKAAPAEEISWYSMSARLEMFAMELFGEDVRFESGRSSQKNKYAEITLTMPGGKKIQLGINDVTGLELEE